MPAVCLQGRTGPWRIRSCELSRVSVVLLSCRWASVLSSPCFCPAGGWRSGELDIITPPVQVCSWERVCCGLMHWKSAMAGSACANVFSERSGAAAINHFWQRGQPCWGQQLWAPGLPELCITTESLFPLHSPYLPWLCLTLIRSPDLQQGKRIRLQRLSHSQWAILSSLLPLVKQTQPPRPQKDPVLWGAAPPDPSTPWSTPVGLWARSPLPMASTCAHPHGFGRERSFCRTTMSTNDDTIKLKYLFKICHIYSF